MGIFKKYTTKEIFWHPIQIKCNGKVFHNKTRGRWKFTQYLIWVRDLLERGHSTNKLELIDAEGFHIPLLKGLQDRWIRDRASKQVDKWSTMDEVFNSITFYADQSNKTRIYSRVGVRTGIIDLGKQGYAETGLPLVSTKGAILYLEGWVPKAKWQQTSMLLKVNNRWTNNRARLPHMTARTIKR